MRGNKFLFTGILVLFGIIFLSMNFASAALDMVFTSPASAENVTGTYTFNVTLTGGVGGNTTFYWYDTAAPGGLVKLCSNITQNVTMYTCSGNTTFLPDGAQVFNATTLINNGTGVNANVTVLVLNGAPVPSLIGYVNGTIRNQTNLTVNISILESNAFLGNITTKSACKVNVNGTNQTLLLTVKNETIGTCNTTTLSLKNLNDGNQTIKIYANNSAGLWGQVATSTVFIDAIAPSIDLDATTIEKTAITLAITASDGYGTGVSSCTADRTGAVVSGTTSLTESGLACGTSYTYIVTCEDKNGHAGSVEKAFTTTGCGGTISHGGGGSTTKPSKYLFTKITPGVATIVKDFDSAIGLKQIQIQVNNPAQNVLITVTKYDGKPTNVSISKTGKVYQYVQVEATNLADKLSQATIQFRVTKSWASSNSLAKENIVVSKFDSAANKWNELTTTYASEDSTYYYYDVVVPSFSYFAVSEKTVVASGDTGNVGDENGAGAEGGSLTWLWIVIGLAVVGVIIWFVMKKNK